MWDFNRITREFFVLIPLKARLFWLILQNLDTFKNFSWTRSFGSFFFLTNSFSFSLFCYRTFKMSCVWTCDEITSQTKAVFGPPSPVLRPFHFQTLEIWKFSNKSKNLIILNLFNTLKVYNFIQKPFACLSILIELISKTFPFKFRLRQPI